MFPISSSDFQLIQSKRENEASTFFRAEDTGVPALKLYIAHLFEKMFYKQELKRSRYDEDL